MELASEPELRLNIYTADPNTPTADGLKLLASWAATRDADNAIRREALPGRSGALVGRSQVVRQCGGNIAIRLR